MIRGVSGFEPHTHFKVIDFFYDTHKSLHSINGFYRLTHNFSQENHLTNSNTMTSNVQNTVSICFIALFTVAILSIKPVSAGVASTPGGSIRVADTCTQTYESDGSLQDAINDAESGDVICLDSGTFTGPIQVSTPGLTLRAADGAEPVISGGNDGIVISGADNTVIHGLEVRGASNEGIKVENSADVTIVSTAFEDNANAIFAQNAPGLHIAENDIFEQRLAFRRGFGIDIVDSESVHIRQNIFRQNPNGIRLVDSPHGFIDDNEFSDGNTPAINLITSDSITVSGNSITESNFGVRVESSVGVTVSENTISDNIQYGIILMDESAQAQITDNTLSGNPADIYMVESPFATITDNTMQTGILINPNNIRSDFTAGRTHFDHTMSGNTVNGAPLFYGKGVTADDIPADAGQVIIHESDGLELSGRSYSDVATGLIISHSDNVTLTDITAEDNSFDGVLVVVSEWTSVTDSRFENNGRHGIFLESSRDSEVSQSSASNNGGAGMIFFWSINSTFEDNSATNNGEEGIYHWSSNNGTVTGNTAVENRTGILVARSHRTPVIGNTATDNNRHGITVEYVRSPQILDNITMNNQGSGIVTNMLELTGAITGNVSTHNQSHGIQLHTFHSSNSDITVQDNDFNNNNRHGVSFEGSRDILLTENRIFENGENGIMIPSSTANARIQDNEITGNAMTGIEINSMAADVSRISRNVISGHPVDIWMNDTRRAQQISQNEMETGILITGNLIENFDAFINGNTVGGRELYYSRFDSEPEIPADAGQVIIYRANRIEIDSLSFENVVAGVQVGFSDTLIVRNSTFAGMEVGLNATGNELTIIEDNTFAENATGLILRGNHAPALLSGNEFLSNQLGLDVRGLRETADARNNWWGSASGPSGDFTDPETGTVADGSGDAIFGTTLFDPWLDQGTIPTSAGEHDGSGRFPDGGINGQSELPEAFSLAQNYPNPFNPATQIEYSVPEASHVRLTVYDMLGREISVLVDQNREPGRYQVAFDASALSSGIYLYRMEAAGHVLTRRMTLVK